MYFNTSNVTIQLFSNCSSALRSRHFNTSNVTIQPFIILPLSYLPPYFNTSNVTIQRYVKSVLIVPLFHFNTSNVTIQRQQVRCTARTDRISIHLMLLFNEPFPRNNNSWYTISIHLMLLFNTSLFISVTILSQFQYI